MGRREENKRLKREALERQGLAVLHEHGYEVASIEQIAQAAGVARGTFYLYFPDKLALFEALMDRWFSPVLGVMDDVGVALSRASDGAGALEAYRSMALGLAMVGLAHEQEILVAFRESRQPGEAGQSIRRRELQLLEAVVRFTEDAAARGLIQVRDPRLVCLVVFGAVERLFYEVLMGADIGDPQAAAQEVLGLFAGALGLPQS